MARAALSFRQRDVAAAIKAVERTGHQVARVSINYRDGSIIVELAPPVGNGPAPEPAKDNPWDAPYYEYNAKRP